MGYYCKRTSKRCSWAAECAGRSPSWPAKCFGMTFCGLTSRTWTFLEDVDHVTPTMKPTPHSRLKTYQRLNMGVVVWRCGDAVLWVTSWVISHHSCSREKNAKYAWSSVCDLKLKRNVMMQQNHDLQHQSESTSRPNGSDHGFRVVLGKTVTWTPLRCFGRNFSSQFVLENLPMRLK